MNSHVKPWNHPTHATHAADYCQLVSFYVWGWGSLWLYFQNCLFNGIFNIKWGNWVMKIHLSQKKDDNILSTTWNLQDLTNMNTESEKVTPPT